MNILNMNLDDFYEVMEDKDNVKRVSDEIKNSQQSSKSGNYEWAHFMCLIYGKKCKEIAFTKITTKYLSEFYASVGAVQHALSTAIEGKTGNDAGSYTKDDFEKKQLTKFTNGAYQNVQTVNDLLDSIEIEIKNKIAGGPNSSNFINNIKTNMGGLVINNSGKVINNMSIEALIKYAVSNNKKQIVLTGAPGTGKTHSVKKYVKDYIDKYNNSNTPVFSEFVQFHPSYDYSDFIEGLRPVQKNNNMVFERVDGLFKKFCRKVAEYNKKAPGTLNGKYGTITDESPLFYFIIDEINRADLSKVFGELMYCLEDSYRGEENAIPTQYSNLVTYDTEKGRYLDGKDGRTDIFSEGFYIPQNVVIIGTMNDIDKSVEAFDFALRRRFEWIDVKANAVMSDTLKSMYKDNQSKNKNEYIEKLSTNIIAMNEYLSGEGGSKFKLSEAYHIGPSYFKGLDLTDDNTFKSSLQKVFNHNIASILREYTRGKDVKMVHFFIQECASKLGVDYEG